MEGVDRQHGPHRLARALARRGRRPDRPAAGHRPRCRLPGPRRREGSVDGGARPDRLRPRARRPASAPDDLAGPSSPPRRRLSSDPVDRGGATGRAGHAVAVRSLAPALTDPPTADGPIEEGDAHRPARAWPARVLGLGLGTQIIVVSVERLRHPRQRGGRPSAAARRPGHRHRSVPAGGRRAGPGRRRAGHDDQRVRSAGRRERQRHRSRPGVGGAPGRRRGRGRSARRTGRPRFARRRRPRRRRSTPGRCTRPRSTGWADRPTTSWATPTTATAC